MINYIMLSGIPHVIYVVFKCCIHPQQYIHRYFIIKVYHVRKKPLYGVQYIYCSTTQQNTLFIIKGSLKQLWYTYWKSYGVPACRHQWAENVVNYQFVLWDIGTVICIYCHKFQMLHSLYSTCLCYLFLRSLGPRKEQSWNTAVRSLV